MNNFYFIFFLLISVISQAQIVDIPDASFKHALLVNDVDTNNDGEIQVSEAEATTDLYISNFNIDSLEGIQSFTNLVLLDCDSNNLSSLDLSQNLNLEFLLCSNNVLTSLDFTQNPNLEHLQCSYNQLTNIDVTQNPNFNFLDCGYNQLTSLDVTHNPNLIHLTIRENSILNLDVTQNSNLEWFFCSQNELTNLNVTQNQNLEYLNFSNNLLTNIDVSQNPNLRTLQCYENQLTNIDVSQNSNLEVLACGANSLTYLNIRNGNNFNMIKMIALFNSNLNCILVDDETATYPDCNMGDLTGWCKDDWASYSEDCDLGSEDFSPINITLYPNPAQNVLNIESQKSFYVINIYSIEGVLVKETTNPSINVSNLPTGLYFAQILSEGKKVTKKFIKS